MAENELESPVSLRHRKSFELAASARAIFVPEHRGNPLGSYLSLLVEDRPYNLWLTDLILKPLLARWSGIGSSDEGRIESLVKDVDQGSHRVRLAFYDILPSAACLGAPAILAIMGVTANLQRTLGLIGEFMVSEKPANPAPTFRLSRYWSGLTEYPADAPGFFAAIHVPDHSSRLRPRRHDPGHLRNALWCSSREIDQRCSESIAILRREIRRAGMFTPEDLRHLLPQATP